MKIMEKIEHLMASEEFQQKAAMVNSPEALQQLCSQYGVELTIDEIKEMTVSVGTDGELSDDQLDNVAGGGFFSWLFEKLKKKNTDDLGRLSGLYD